MAIVAGALNHVRYEMGSGGCASTIAANENVTIRVPRGCQDLDAARDSLRVDCVKRVKQLRFVLLAEV